MSSREPTSGIADRRPHVALLAAVLLSIAAHAAVVMLGDREPLPPSVRPGATDAAVLQGRLGPAWPTPAITARAPLTVPGPMDRARADADRATSSARSGANRHVDAIRPPNVALPAPRSEARPDRPPTPLTYPVISLPPDDDPHRIGLVRLLMVVSSEGRVVRTVVGDATLSQDYVDRITRSFEDVRFEPAHRHGLPSAGWYEVVVDLAFDPDGGTSL